jgi:hypothetical protein
MSESVHRLAELAPPRLVGTGLKVSEDRPEGFPGRRLRLGEPERRKPLLGVHFEHGWLSELAEVSRPDSDETRLRGTSKEPICDIERAAPAPLDSPTGCRSPNLISLAVVNEREHINELSKLAHRDLAPSVRDEYDGVMVGVGGEKSLDTNNGRHGRLEQLGVEGRPQGFGPLYVLVDLDAETKAGPLERVKVVVRAAKVIPPLWRPFALLEPEASRQ